MLDIHPPEHTPHTWRDFFIHIATIVVGLVIAVGLEQAVEAVHHHQQREDLLQELQSNGEKTLFDCRNTQTSLQQRLQFDSQQISQLRTAIAAHRSPPPIQPVTQHDFDEPSDSVWKAAKANGLINLLSEREIQSYSEADELVNIIEDNHVKYWETGTAIQQFLLRFPVQADGSSADLTSMSPAQVSQYLDLLTADYMASKQFLLWDQCLMGAQEAIQSGERNLDRIELSERKYTSLPPLPGNLPPAH